MLRVIRWLDEYIEYTLSFLFYVYLTGIIFVEVVRRYVFNDSSSYGEETAIYAFIWMTYIAAAKGVKERSHLSVSILVDNLGRRGKFITSMLSDVCFMVLAVVIFYYSLVAVSQSVEFDQTMRGLNAPMWLAIISVPFGWFLIMVRIVQRSFKMIRAYSTGGDLFSSGSDVTQ